MICANPDCKKHFEPRTHNQKYCSSECCKIVTNEDIKRKYHEKRARLRGAVRLCKNNCGTVLSRYNKYDTCSFCDTSQLKNERLELKGLLGVIQG